VNKRSAMIVAAGLIVALVAGAYALALGVTGPATQAQAKTTAQKPAAHTKTVTVHKNAPSSHGGAAMSAPIAGSGGGGGGSYSYSGSSSTGGGTHTTGGGSQEDGGYTPPPSTGTPSSSPSPSGGHDD
jgi:uncharacterized membrane protein YgcG